VPSLSIPGSEAPSNVDALSSHDATRLFMERARAVVPRLIFNDRDADRIIGLCRQLDGIPLAIELAAVHVQILSLAELSLRLGDQLHLLTGGMRTAPSRQQTLRAMRDWSYSPSQDHRREWGCLRFNGVTALIRGQSRS
jgi:predicted ATPase